MVRLSFFGIADVPVQLCSKISCVHVLDRALESIL